MIPTNKKSICLGVSIDGALRQKNKSLSNLFFNDDGEKIDGKIIRDELLKAKEKGFEVFPPCHHHSEKGNCLGHPQYLALICLNCAIKIGFKDSYCDLHHKTKSKIGFCELCNNKESLREIEISEREIYKYNQGVNS